MSNIVQISDFTGFYYLSVNSSCESELQSYIDKYEKYYLLSLLGTDLYALFIADLVAGVPQDPNYLEFYNAFFESIDCVEDEIRSSGLVECLTGLIFYHFARNDNYQHSLTGVVTNENENSKVLSPINTEMFAQERWNDNVESFNSISYKIYDLDLLTTTTRIEIKFLDII